MCQPAANRIASHPDDLAILTKFTRMCHQTIAVAPKWCHSDAMDLTPYVDNLRHELAVAAEAGGEDAKALADRLTAPLESAVRLTLLDALSAAAAEITRDLAPGSVDLRLRGREPEFVVAPAISEPAPALVEEEPTPAPRPVTESDDASMTRINCGWGKTSKTGSRRRPGKPGSPSTRGWFARLQRLWKAARTEALRDSARPKVPKASAAGCTDTGFIFRTTLFHQPRQPHREYHHAYIQHT